MPSCATPDGIGSGMPQQIGAKVVQQDWAIQHASCFQPLQQSLRLTGGQNCQDARISGMVAQALLFGERPTFRRPEVPAVRVHKVPSEEGIEHAGCDHNGPGSTCFLCSSGDGPVQIYLNKKTKLESNSKRASSFGTSQQNYRSFHRQKQRIWRRRGCRRPGEGHPDPIQLHHFPAGGPPLHATRLIACYTGK